MNLFEVYTDDSPLPFGLQYFQPMSFFPCIEEAADGKLYKLIYFFYDNKYIPYVLLNDKELKMEPIPFEPHITRAEHPNVLRVKITSINEIVADYDKDNNELLLNGNDEISIKKIKDVPELMNVDQYTDEEFKNRFKRPKMDFEHGGMVGYIFLTMPQREKMKKESFTVNKSSSTDIDTTTPGLSNSSSSEKSDNKYTTATLDDAEKQPSKLQQAIQMFNANRSIPRKVLINRYKSILGLSPSVASTYYTHAKHIVTDPTAKGKVAYWQE